MDGERTRRSALRGLATVVAAGVAGCGHDGDTGSADVTLDVAPAEPLVDEVVDVTVEGLEPGSRATLAVAADDDGGRTWRSFARFEADDRGRVDPAEQAPLAGTYDGVDPMGLFWSLRPPDDDATPPAVLPDDEGRVPTRVAVRVDRETAAETTVTRRYSPPDAAWVEPDGDLVGQYVAPPGDGPHPGVVALHGSGGRPQTGLAALLAANGFATLAPRYFGGPGLPDELVGVPVEYVRRAMAWLRDRPEVADGQVGLVGGSKGAELALLAGATFDGVGAVVATAPSAVVWQGLAGGGGPAGSSWTHEGEPLPHVPLSFPPSLVADAAWRALRGRPIALRSTYGDALDTVDEGTLSAATIPVERVDGPVVLVSGERDALWPSARMGEMAARRLREAGHPDFEHLSYPGAGHAITAPYRATTRLTAVGQLLPGAPMALGGTPAGLARAAADWWPAALDALGRGLP